MRPRPIRAGIRLDFPPARKKNRSGRSLTLQGRAELHLALQAFVPGGPEAGRRPSSDATGRNPRRWLPRPSSLQLEELIFPLSLQGRPPRPGTRSGSRRSSHPPLSHHARGRQHAELPAHLVLRCRRAVRIEDVPFVKHCIRDLPRRSKLIARSPRHLSEAEASAGPSSPRGPPRFAGASGGPGCRCAAQPAGMGKVAMQKRGGPWRAGTS